MYVEHVLCKDTCRHAYIFVFTFSQRKHSSLTILVFHLVAQKKITTFTSLDRRLIVVAMVAMAIGNA